LLGFHTVKIVIVGGLIALLAASTSVGGRDSPRMPSALAAAAKDEREWPAYGGDALGSRYSPLAEITRDNVRRLRVAWTFHTGETPASAPTRRPTAFEATPIVVGGALYLATPLGRVFALDPATGQERWRFDARVDPASGFGDFTSRGVSTWLDPAAAPDAPCRRRILVATVDARLIALDARDGALCAGFGESGMVDLRRALRNAPASGEEYEVTSPPAVIGGLVIVGSGIADNNRTRGPRLRRAHRCPALDVGSRSSRSGGPGMGDVARRRRTPHGGRERLVGDRGRPRARHGGRAHEQCQS
jgi:glucose dehydrogenase